jgi:DNA repair protein RadC
MSKELFADFERELIDAARMVLADGVRRLKDRENLFPTNRAKSRADRAECRAAREAVTASLVADYGSLRHEIAVAVLIDAQGRLITIEEFPQGKATHVEMSPRILAGMVIDSGATTVLLAHNHPSGDNTPSEQDIKVTQSLGAWLAMMEVSLLDHLVLSGEGASAIMGEWT